MSSPTRPQPADDRPLLSTSWQIPVGFLLVLFAGLLIYWLIGQACPQHIWIWAIVVLFVAGLSIIVTAFGKISDSKYGSTGAVAIFILFGGSAGIYIETNPNLLFVPCQTGLYLKGDVRDAVSGQVLTDASVVVKGLSVGNPKTKLTDGQGAFDLDLPLKANTGDPLILVEISKNRYQSQTLRLSADSLKTRNRFLSVALQPDSAQPYRFAGRVMDTSGYGLAEVLVVSDDGTLRSQSNAEGFFDLKFKAKNQPVLRLTFQKKGYKPHVQYFHLPEEAEPYEKSSIRITLRPPQP